MVGCVWILKRPGSGYRYSTGTADEGKMLKGPKCSRWIGGQNAKAGGRKRGYVAGIESRWCSGSGYVCQWRSFKFDPSRAKCPGSGTEIIPGKHSDTRINKAFDQRPWPLHDRYNRTDTCFRWGMAVTYNRYKFVTVPLPKRFRNGRFTSETAVRRFQK
jgi:hypothetical protein